jgi:hypothetical protein
MDEKNATARSTSDLARQASASAFLELSLQDWPNKSLNCEMSVKVVTSRNEIAQTNLIRLSPPRWKNRSWR